VLQLTRCTAIQGWVLVQRGQGHEGIAQIRQGLDAQRAARAGRGFNSGNYHWGAVYEAEIYRLKGELLLQQALPDAAQAEVCFQQAKSWELRAAMSLSRLWQRQGKSRGARALLAPIYGWFTEGFDTPDLQEAKVLLDELP